MIETEKSKKKTTRVADDYAYRSAQLANDLKGIVTEYGIKGVVGELPSGGAQSAKAMVQMNMATAIVAATMALLNIPVEWCTPEEVKKAATGFRSANKIMMMKAVIEFFGGKVIEKPVKCKVSKNYPDGIRMDYKWKFLNEVWPSGKFEHIADSLGAMMALKDGNMVRMFG